MRKVCTVCYNNSPDGNLWCQEINCPAGDMPDVLELGEKLGNIEIIKLVQAARTYALYEAQRDGERILVKIAHDSEPFRERLKQETAKYLELRGKHTMLPLLQNPNRPGAPTQNECYGRIVYKDHKLYYAVFAFVEGDSLRNLLLRNPQPWNQHVGWLIISLGEVLSYLHRNGHYHRNLSPEAVVVRTDKMGILRPVLIDLGLFGCDAKVCGQASYTAPEILSGKHSPAQAQSDIYGLGILLYEMLAGNPAYPFKLQREKDIQADILSNTAIKLDRSDLDARVGEIVAKAINSDASARYSTVDTFSSDLKALFKPVPQEKTRRPLRAGVINIVLWLVVAGLLLIVVIFIVSLVTVPETLPALTPTAP